MTEYFGFILITAICLFIIGIHFTIKVSKERLNLFDIICDAVSLYMSIWSWYWVGIAGGLTEKMAVLCLELPAAFLILGVRVTILLIMKDREETCKNKNN